LRDRKICFPFNASKQQILRYAQDDTSESSFLAASQAHPRICVLVILRRKYGHCTLFSFDYVRSDDMVYFSKSTILAFNQSRQDATMGGAKRTPE
jgi:transcription termination factor Rho